MKIACIGGGPAGLYFAISMKLRDPAHEIEVFERNAPGVTFGWGVVFSDQTVDNLTATTRCRRRSSPTNSRIGTTSTSTFSGETITSSGHGFIGIGRKRLLEILQDRARELGVVLHFDAECDPADPKWRDYDLVIASDGINSRFRDAACRKRSGSMSTCAPTSSSGSARPRCSTPSPSPSRRPSTAGSGRTPIASRPTARPSSSNVRKRPGADFGFDRMDQAEAIAACEKLFAKYLDGHGCMSNAAHLRGSAAWLNFRRIKCERWSSGNVILLGDAAHTAHFSIGSGTKLALEDAIKLAEVLNRPGLSLEAALDEYQAERSLEVLKLQNSARNSTEWFETLERYLHFEPLQFAYSLLTRTQRISHENLRLRDREWLEGVERWFWKRATDGRSNKTAPPMFAPFKLREMEVENRITVSPMAMYSAVDGMPNDFHLVHYGERALGGAGLVFTEMTCVSPEGRISPGCTGMWNADHVAAWKRIVDFVHANSKAKICLQLGHSGGKGSTKLGWEGNDVPLDDGNWPVMAASDVPWSPVNQVPRPMTRADMDAVRDQFVAAVRMGLEARLRHGRAARRARLSAVELHHAAAEQAHRRIWRQPRKPPALSARSVRGDARRLAVGQADVGAHFGDRLGGRARHHARRSGADRRSLRARRRGPDRRLGGPDLGRGAAGLRPHVPDARSATRSATRRASRPWRSATSTSPTTPIRSSPPAAPTWSRSPART